MELLIVLYPFWEFCVCALLYIRWTSHISFHHSYFSSISFVIIFFLLEWYNTNVEMYSFNKSAFFRASWMGWLPTTKDIAVTSVKVTQIAFLKIIIRQKDQTIINVNDSCIVFFFQLVKKSQSTIY